MTEEERWGRSEPRPRGGTEPPPRSTTKPRPQPRRDPNQRLNDPSAPPSRGPSAPPDLRFNPLSTGIGVFAAVAIPFVVYGYTRPSGVNTTIIVIGVLAGLLVGFLAGAWVAHRDGFVWRGPRL